MASDHIKLEIEPGQNVAKPDHQPSAHSLITLELDGNVLEVYGNCKYGQACDLQWMARVELTDEQLAALRGTAGKLPWQPIKLGRRDRL